MWVCPHAVAVDQTFAQIVGAAFPGGGRNVDADSANRGTRVHSISRTDSRTSLCRQHTRMTNQT